MTSHASEPQDTPNAAPSYTSIELHSSSTLLNSPHLPTLFALINYTFNVGHNPKGHSYIPWSDHPRLMTLEQLGEEVGPDGFILLMLEQNPPQRNQVDLQNSSQAKSEGFLSPSGQRIIGTASAKPYTITKKEPEQGIVSSFFKRPPPSTMASTTDDGTPQWEILAMVVDPALQGRGVATQLMNLTVDEIKRRCGSNLRDPGAEDSTNAKDGQEKKNELLLLLSTMADINESYYAKRSWTATAKRKMPKGTLGSEEGFSVVEMFKRVPL
ncbi:hypothetical protein ACLMJK_002926 [Lecanora helva]